MFKKVFLNLLSLLFRVIPRNKHLWVTGKITSWEYSNTPPAFFDNSKHFFLYLVNNTDEKVYWISSSDKEIEMLRKMNLPVVRFPSLRGIVLVLRAKFSFHHYGPDQIEPILQRGQVQLDFWHGTPLKKIRYDIVEKPAEKHNPYLDLMKKGGIEYIFSTSPYLSEKVLKGAFGVDQDKMLNFGYPRMDVMRLSKQENIEFCRKYSPELIPYIKMAEKHDKVFLYMPTFRDDDPEYFEKANIDFNAMSEELRKINGIFFLKLHPLTRHSSIKDYDNIVQIGNDVDIYPFLIYTTHLITDYSSIFFDYLPLDKEILFIPYDYDNYISHRELYFDYNEITPGKKFYDFKTLIQALPDIDNLNYADDRKRISELLIDNYHFDACERTYRFIKERYLQISDDRYAQSEISGTLIPD